MPVVHLTARLRPPIACLVSHTHAPWLWARLRRAFPDALATVLMPNHPHMLAVVSNVAQAHGSFVRVLAAFAKRLDRRPPIWEPVPAAKVLEDPHKVLRDVRYIGLNPPRDRLVRDPLGWYWSTHRDVVGATHDPWVTFERLQRFIPGHIRDRASFHGYLSADPSVDVRGTPLPRPAPDTTVPHRPLRMILAAAAASTRATTQHIRRRSPTRTAFVHLAHAQGWTHTKQLAELCGVTRQGIAQIRRRPAEDLLRAARLTLGDVRLIGAQFSKMTNSASNGALRRPEFSGLEN